MSRVDPAHAVLAHIAPGKNVPVADVPTSRRLRRAYTLGLVSFVTLPDRRGQYVTLTPAGRDVRKTR